MTSRTSSAFIHGLIALQSQVRELAGDTLDAEDISLMPIKDLLEFIYNPGSRKQLIEQAQMAGYIDSALTEGPGGCC